MSNPGSIFSPSVFSDPALCRGLLNRLKRELDQPLRFMEVCGTHTVSIFRSGLRSLLPENITHLSGPGCPVCVTHESEVAVFLDLARREDVIIATFGDLLRVPGPDGRSLKAATAEGAHVAIVYSPLDALALAAKEKDRQVVFLGVGFETTAPTTAATVKAAKAQGLNNFSVLSFHKLVPPALRLLLEENGTGETGIDAFLLPGHVATISGLAPFRFIATEYGKPGVVAGFEPSDILEALLMLVQARAAGKADIYNEYSRVVAPQGNPHAWAVVEEVFKPVSSLWRGLGRLDNAGLAFVPEYEQYDAMARFGLTLQDVPPIKGCMCGEILRGRMSPMRCPLFGTRCTPASPVGPCMVSSEGSCSAYFKYRTDRI